ERLQHHASSANACEGHCQTRQCSANDRLSSRSQPQTGPRDLPLENGDNRLPLGTSVCPLRAGKVCRLTDEITAATLFSGLELKGVPRPGALHRGRCPL